jgi:hypothetical protein
MSEDFTEVTIRLPGTDWILPEGVIELDSEAAQVLQKLILYAASEDSATLTLDDNTPPPI